MRLNMHDLRVALGVANGERFLLPVKGLNCFCMGACDQPLTWKHHWEDLVLEMFVMYKGLCIREVYIVYMQTLVLYSDLAVQPHVLRTSPHFENRSDHLYVGC